MPKPLLSISDSSSPGLGPPLFMNGGLIGSMDSMVAMQNLRGGIPGIPISGIMAAGFPHGFPAAVQAAGAGEDAKNGLSMLPLMLHGIPHPHGAALPQHALFSVGTMMTHTPPPPPHPSSSSPSSAAKVTTTAAPEAGSPSSTTPVDRESAAAAAGDHEKCQEEKGGVEVNKRPGAVEAAALITSTSRAHVSSAHLGSGTGSHLTFNPFLIPGMSHGLLYPHMFLPHGGIMALPAMPPGAVDGSPGSPKRRKKRGREEGDREEDKAVAGEAEERESTVQASVESHPGPSSSPSIPPTSAPDPGPPPTEQLQTGPGDAEGEPSEPQEADSHKHPEENQRRVEGEEA